MHHQVTSDAIKMLNAVALQIRIDSIRATTASKSGHPTSCLSAADILATLFFSIIRMDVNNPSNPTNDRFILSKGHAVPALYAVFKHLNIISDEELLTLRQFSSRLEGHPTPRFPFNEAATGSLGQGLSIGVGMALHAKRYKIDYKVYVLMGDGEIAEGSVWEGAELASFYKLNNMIAIVDCNRLGQSGSTVDEHHVEKIAQKFTAFGWESIIVDGHNTKELIDAITSFNGSDKPKAIIARTFKGYGLDFTENKNGFHGKPLSEQEAINAITLLKKRFSNAATYPLPFSYKPPLPLRSPNENVSFKINKEKNNLHLSSHHFEKNDRIAPRKAFGIALADLGEQKADLVVLDADVKNSTYTDIFEQKYPERFIQCFIAEQNMISVATGFALRGKTPFAATFGAFFTRAHDQIRMASIGRVPLRLAGSHCGVSIGEDGPSQMALEDLAMMRSIPNSTVLYPSDAHSAYALTHLMYEYEDGISYIRTTREALSLLYSTDDQFKIGGCKVLKQSSQDKVCIITAGITVHEALKAYENLQEQDIIVAIIDLYSIKPLDRQTLISTIKNTGGKFITVEDHYLEGGLGEAVMQATYGMGFTGINLAVPHISRSGKPQELLQDAQIDALSIMRAVQKLVNF